MVAIFCYLAESWLELRRLERRYRILITMHLRQLPERDRTAAARLSRLRRTENKVNDSKKQAVDGELKRDDKDTHAMSLEKPTSSLSDELPIIL